MKKILTIICGLLLSITPGILKAQVIIVQPQSSPTMDDRLKEMGQRYDNNYSTLSDQYNELMGMSDNIVNKINLSILKQYQDDVKKWTKENLGKMDLGNERTFTSISNYLNQWKTNADIMYEKSIGERVVKELDNIKNIDPTNFESAPRFIRLKQAIHEMIYCLPSEIPKIVQKYNI